MYNVTKENHLIIMYNIKETWEGFDLTTYFLFYVHFIHACSFASWSVFVKTDHGVTKQKMKACGDTYIHTNEMH